ncbi:deoxyribose-phosphate aldolase [Corynebacterium capitovis DSM 44611]|uniref:hypothetical protein n=1 Tax=Corynebacterium capitovis TaxID=131081 RepID=UPI0006844910|nr:hypothetical protein [Corynebacterium capitovis]WKD56760.1 deoxyribose-phosphate aldolase [Corynebacterium capitovis DSM 44611]
MNNVEWLATRTGLSLLGESEPFPEPSPRHRMGVVVEPTHIGTARRRGLPVFAVVGWPTGRHHSVIKAAEARLAVEAGASEVWLALDPAVTERNALLADIVAVRQAVEDPARLGVVVTGDAAVWAAERAGADRLVVSSGQSVPQSRLDVVVLGVEDSPEAVIEALEAGATGVFTAVNLPSC